MNIGIITVYNSMNFGAFLQAFAMQSLIKERNHNVYFIKHSARKPFFHTVLESIYKFFKLKCNGSIFLYIWKKYINYKKAWKLFPIRSIHTFLSTTNGIIFGSDEIWNVRRREINRYPIFFGCGLEKYSKIAFAPSINDSTLNDFLQHPELIQALKKFRHIAVRGRNSQKVISQLIDSNIEMVMDPTLLIPKKYYDNLAQPYSNNDYILLYLYSNTLTKEKREQIINYSKNIQKKMVSVLAYNSWCDENPQLSVGELLSCFEKSDIVLTNTFHGTILAIIYNKQFISLAEDSNTKVMELLELLNLENRLLHDHSKIEDIIATHIDYSLVNDILAKEKTKSNKILDSFLENIDIRQRSAYYEA